jgi:hypothetical protein
VSPSSSSKKTPARRSAPRRPAPPAKHAKSKPVAKARPKAAPRPPSKSAKKTPPKTPAKPTPKGSARPAPKGSSKSAPKSAAAEPAPPSAPPRSGDSRRHVLSLSFLRDGDEFLARLETDGGQITELKNRALDQLLTLVAGELEDLLE